MQKNMAIPERLREVRKELALSQATLAQALNVTERSVMNWEQGIAAPNVNVLERYAALGADVLYVITGKRIQPRAVEALPQRQRALIANYEAADKKGQHFIEYAAVCARKASEPRQSRKKIP